MHRVEGLGLAARQVRHPSCDHLQARVLEAGVDLSDDVLGNRVGLDDRERAFDGHDIRSSGNLKARQNLGLYGGQVSDQRPRRPPPPAFPPPRLPPLRPPPPYPPPPPPPPPPPRVLAMERVARRCSRPRSAADRAASARRPCGPGAGAATGTETTAAAAEIAPAAAELRGFCTKRLSKVCSSGFGMRDRIEIVVVAIVVTAHGCRAPRGRAPQRASSVARPRLLTLPPPAGRAGVRRGDRLVAAACRGRVLARLVAPTRLGRSSPRASLGLAAGEAADRANVGVVQIDPDAALEAARQHHGAVADADQAADRQADGVEQLAHLAVAAFGDDDAVPVVRALAAAVLDRAEAGRLAVDLDAFEQHGLAPRRRACPARAPRTRARRRSADASAGWPARRSW